MIKLPSVKAFAEEAFFAAIRLEEKQLVTILLEEGISPDAKESASNTSPLVMAVKTGNCALVSLLIQYGPNIVYDASSSYHSLIAAVEKGSIELVELLVQVGAAVNYSNMLHRSPSLLSKAIESGKLDIGKLLLTYGANVNDISYSRPIRELSEKKVSCLTGAIFTEDIDFVGLPLANGANVNLQRVSSFLGRDGKRKRYLGTAAIFALFCVGARHDDAPKYPT